MKAFPQTREFFSRRRHLHRQSAARRGDRQGARQARRDVVVQRQGQRALRVAQEAARRGPAPAARRLRVRQPADPAQHQEGHAHRGGGEIHQGLPRARRRDPRHVHPRPARRVQGDDPRDRRVRQAHQPAHHPGVAGRALSPARSSTTRRSRTAGWTRRMRSWSTTAESRSRRCTTRTSRTARSSTRWKASTRSSISAPARSPRSSARC